MIWTRAGTQLASAKNWLFNALVAYKVHRAKERSTGDEFLFWILTGKERHDQRSFRSSSLYASDASRHEVDRLTSLIWLLSLEKSTCCRVCSRPATYCSMLVIR